MWRLSISTSIQLSSLILISFFTCIKATTPSSCGNISNISCPFRLKGDHQECDSRPFSYELECLNNRTVIYLPDRRPRFSFERAPPVTIYDSYYFYREDDINYDYYYFYVEDINYDHSAVRIVDPGLDKDNCSFLPLQSIQYMNFISYLWDNTPVTFIDCRAPAISSHRYLNITTTATSCGSSYTENNNITTSLESSSSSEDKYYYPYSYAVAGRMNVSEVEDNCKLSKITWVSSQWPISNFSDVHDGMAFGFQVSWLTIFCSRCKVGKCYVDRINNIYKCERYNYFSEYKKH